MNSVLTGSSDPGNTNPVAPAADLNAVPEPQKPDPAAILEQCLGPERTPVLFPDLPLASALPHFRRWPLLPVTNRAARGALEGVVSMTDVLERYQAR